MRFAYCALRFALGVASAFVNRSRLRRSDLLDRAPEFLVALLGNADLDAMRRRAVDAAMRQFAGDHAVAHHVGMQIVAIGLVVDAAADVGPVPAPHMGEPISGVAM